MKELNDKDFDQLFKERMTEGLPPFEEESWRKMEKKLSRRDRFVFYRNASIILLCLSIGLGFYFTQKKALMKTDAIATRKMPGEAPKDGSAMAADVNESHKGPIMPPVEIDAASRQPALTVRLMAKVKSAAALKRKMAMQANVPQAASSLHATAIVKVAPLTTTPDRATETLLAASLPNLTGTTTANRLNPETKPVKTAGRKIPVSVAFGLGPDFSSTENVIGGKGGMTLGISISVGLFKKVSLQTGVYYGTKNYTASSYDYTLKYPGLANTITGINAACRVIEIPLRASYQLSDSEKSSIDVNAGLSSYLMLKEDYQFKYTAASGRKDWLLEKNNANQHYLSVVDLSATYHIKLKNKKFALGLEPYVKIPLSGIGEGKVPLKSSGLSLKMRYGLH
jgi:hypothetical protein